MIREHYDHVRSVYSGILFDLSDTLLEYVIVKNLYTEQRFGDDVCALFTSFGGEFLQISFHAQLSLIVEILKYFKDTEILFV